MPHEIDTSLMHRLRRYGAFDVSACFNCGNCTAVCPLARDTAGFPRRLIRLGQVGMEKRLLADEHLWLCYACGECSQTCPRQADPAQFVAAARRYAISRYEPTGLARLALGSAWGQAILFLLFSALFTLLLLWHQGDMNGRQLALFQFIPGPWIHDIGVALFIVVGLGALSGLVSMVWRFRQALPPEHRPAWSSLPAALFAAAVDALAHLRYRRCDSAADAPAAGGAAVPPGNPGDQPAAESRGESRGESGGESGGKSGGESGGESGGMSGVEGLAPSVIRGWLVHALILWGFLGMLLATTLDLLTKPIGSPEPLWYPVRLLGILSGLACLAGLTFVFTRRLTPGKGLRKPPYNVTRASDWFFLILLAATVLTGLLTLLVVYLPGASLAAYLIFLIHIVLAMDLIVLLPLTKFAHALYRPLALALHRWASPVSGPAKAAASDPA